MAGGLLWLKGNCEASIIEPLLQAQTAECLVVGEIATDQLLVVLNKVDLLPSENRSKLVAKAQKKLLQTFAHTKFKKPPMVAVAAKPGAPSRAFWRRKGEKFANMKR